VEPNLELYVRLHLLQDSIQHWNLGLGIKNYVHRPLVAAMIENPDPTNVSFLDTFNHLQKTDDGKKVVSTPLFPPTRPFPYNRWTTSTIGTTTRTTMISSSPQTIPTLPRRPILLLHARTDMDGTYPSTAVNPSLEPAVLPPLVPEGQQTVPSPGGRHLSLLLAPANQRFHANRPRWFRRRTRSSSLI
jgi:hypothetical protein